WRTLRGTVAKGRSRANAVADGDAVGTLASGSMAEDGHEASAGNRGPTDGPGGAASSGTPGAWKAATPASQDACACAASAVPLFPLLNVVLFPGAVLPLHIFEQRYRVMTADALGTKCAQRPDGRRLICMC